MIEFNLVGPNDKQDTGLLPGGVIHMVREKMHVQKRLSQTVQRF